MAVLVNEGAGRGRHRGLLPDLVQRLESAGQHVRLLSAGTAEEAEAACHAAVTGGAHALVAVGGDGTVHCALQAVAGTGVPLGILPAGTGNDFAAAVGVPGDPRAAAEALTNALREHTTQAVDLGRLANGSGRRWFGAVLACGFDAVVNERANRMRWPRGALRYDLAIVAELLRLRPRRYTLRLDGVERRVDAVLVAVGNGPTYGGGMRICPAASLTDGLLDVLVVGPVGRATFTRIKPRVYAGTHVTHPAVRSYRAAMVEIEAEGVTTYGDGERALPLPITVASAPGALRVLTSAPSSPPR